MENSVPFLLDRMRLNVIDETDKVRNTQNSRWQNNPNEKHHNAPFARVSCFHYRQYCFPLLFPISSCSFDSVSHCTTHLSFYLPLKSCPCLNADTLECGRGHMSVAQCCKQISPEPKSINRKRDPGVFRARVNAFFWPLAHSLCSPDLLSFFRLCGGLACIQPTTTFHNGYKLQPDECQISIS